MNDKELIQKLKKKYDKEIEFFTNEQDSYWYTLGKIHMLRDLEKEIK